VGEKCPEILPKCRFVRYIQGSFTCCKAMAWDRRFYFLSEGRRAENFFFFFIIRRLRPGANPRTWVPKARTLPLRPPKFHTQTHTYSAPPYKIQMPESCAACYTRQATKFHVFNTVIVQTVVFWVVSSGSLLRGLLMFRRNVMPPSSGPRYVGHVPGLTQSPRL
jgi:hypothetical protein